MTSIWILHFYTEIDIYFKHFRVWNVLQTLCIILLFLIPWMKTPKCLNFYYQNNLVLQTLNFKVYKESFSGMKYDLWFTVFRKEEGKYTTGRMSRHNLSRDERADVKQIQKVCVYFQGVSKLFSQSLSLVASNDKFFEAFFKVVFLLSLWCNKTAFYICKILSSFTHTDFFFFLPDSQSCICTNDKKKYILLCILQALVFLNWIIHIWLFAAFVKLHHENEKFKAW